MQDCYLRTEVDLSFGADIAERCIFYTIWVRRVRDRKVGRSACNVTGHVNNRWCGAEENSKGKQCREHC